jgi:hypothetical protein
LRDLDEAIATLLSVLLLIGAGCAALCWWLLRRLGLAIAGLRPQTSLRSPNFLLAARERFFRERRHRWYRAQAVRDERTERNRRTSL